jgi:hypothetical protein
VCIGCTQSLPLSSFNYANKATGKRMTRCKPCTTRQQYERRKVKPCSLCGGPKERLERARLCEACRPWASYVRHLRQHGLTPADYVAILKAQGGGCAICAGPPGGKRLGIDHDHSCCPGRASCGRCVRGVLCEECNLRRLPRFGDDAVLLMSAVYYLLNPPAKRVLRTRRR